MSKYTKEHIPEQLLEIIEQLKTSWGLSAIPYFEESTEFHDDIWSIQLHCILDQDNNVVISSIVHWDETITKEMVNTTWGSTVWLIVKMSKIGYAKGLEDGIQLSKKNFIKKMTELVELPQYKINQKLKDLDAN